MGYRKPETCPWLEVDLLSMKSPGSLVASAASIDVAADGILGDRYHADAGVEAWQSTKWKPTLAVLVVLAGVAVSVAQSPQALRARLLGLTGRIRIATLNSN